MSRRAFTIGITNDDKATIIRDHRSSLREHKAALKELTGEFKEAFILETTRANTSKLVSTGGNVNQVASLSVAAQRNKKLRDVVVTKPAARGNAQGGVNMKASFTVAEQTGRAPVARRRKSGKKAAGRKSTTATAAAASGATDEGVFGAGDSDPSLPPSSES